MDVTPINACCEPLLAAPLGDEEATALASGFAVLADPVRLRLLSMIATAPGEVCACELVEPLDRTQPTISHHLSVLVRAGLLQREQRGRWAYFRAVPERLTVLREALGPGH